MSLARPDLSVVIPAYNEEARIGPSIAQLIDSLRRRDETFEVIVVDDGSRDETAGVVRSFGAPEVRVIAYRPNRGKGRAVRTGMLAARGRAVGFMDADLSTDLEALDRGLVELCNGYDIVIGSRALRDSAILVHQPAYREQAARVFNIIQRQLAGVHGYGDTQCGFKLMTAPAARAIFSRAQIDGFMFDVELLFLAERLGFRVVEMPVSWTNDPASRLRIVRDTARMFRDLLRVRWAGRYLPPPRTKGPARSAIPIGEGRLKAES